MLADAGIDPNGLPLHTGLLIDLRGKIVHEGLEDHERLRTAFYEMEAIVRCLIRKAADLRGGWWPSHDLTAYATPWPERIAALDPTPRSHWHDNELPPTSPPAPERLPRNVGGQARDVLVSVTDELRAAAGAYTDLLANLAADSHMWLAPDDETALTLDVGPGNGFDIEPTRMLVGAERLNRLEDAARFVSLTVDFTGAVGYWFAMREIPGTADHELTLRSAIGSWYQYHRLVVNGELPPELLKLPEPENPADVGVIAGWAGASDERALQALRSLRGRTRELAEAIESTLRTSPPTPLRPALDW